MKDNTGVHLYEIADQIEEIKALLEQAETEDEAESLREALNTAFDELGEDFERKVQAVLAVFRNHKAMANAAKAEKDRLAAIEKSANGQMDWLRGYLLAQMKRADKRSVKTLLGTVTRKPGSKSVKITDPDALPDGTYNIPTEIIPDKKAIRELLDDGVEVPGAELITGDETIQIR